jgi:hypothetical protein
LIVVLLPPHEVDADDEENDRRHRVGYGERDLMAGEEGGETPEREEGVERLGHSRAVREMASVTVAPLRATRDHHERDRPGERHRAEEPEDERDERDDQGRHEKPELQPAIPPTWARQRRGGTERDSQPHHWGQAWRRP